MAYLLQIVKVEDFDKWKHVFDERAIVRKASGSQGGRLLRNVDNPNEIVMILKWDSIENARKLLASDDLKKAIKRAGVIGEPKFYLLDEVEQVPV